MANSAHDDIRLTIPAHDIAKYAGLLSTIPIGRPNDAVQLLTLINRITEAAQQGDAVVQLIVLKFKNSNAKLWLEFSIPTLMTPGWLEYFETDASHYLPPESVHRVIEAIEDGQFEISFDIPEIVGLSLKNLLERLDLCTIGRPSTLPQILEKMEETGMMVIEQDEVRLTEAGYKALVTLKHAYPKVADKNFSAKLSTLQQKIEKGNLSLREAMHQLLPSILNHEDPHPLAEQMWEDIDELYDYHDALYPVEQRGLINIEE